MHMVRGPAETCEDYCKTNVLNASLQIWSPALTLFPGRELLAFARILTLKNSSFLNWLLTKTNIEHLISEILSSVKFFRSRDL